MADFKSNKFINQLSIDCVIFGYDNKKLKVLVPKLNFEGDFWALPSGFVLQDEGIDQAAKRILEERTGINNIYLEQYHVFGDVPRTNQKDIDRILALNQTQFDTWGMDNQFMQWLTQRFVSIGYYALVNINKVVPKLMDIDCSIDWHEISALPKMIGDHNEQVKWALDALRLQLDKKLLGFNMLPQKFTMKELQQLYETVYDRPYRRNNFQKKMLDLGVLERLEKKYTGASNKAPYLYRFMT